MKTEIPTKIPNPLQTKYFSLTPMSVLYIVMGVLFLGILYGVFTSGGGWLWEKIRGLWVGITPSGDGIDWGS